MTPSSATKTLLATFALAAALGASPALAQSEPRSGLGSGLSAGGPGDRTGSVTGAGQTKPPGAAEGQEAGTNGDLERKSRELDRKIESGICKGC